MDAINLDRSVGTEGLQAKGENLAAIAGNKILIQILFGWQRLHRAFDFTICVSNFTLCVTRQTCRVTHKVKNLALITLAFFLFHVTGLVVSGRVDEKNRI